MSEWWEGPGVLAEPRLLLAPSQKAAQGAFKRPVITSSAWIKMDFSKDGPEFAHPQMLSIHRASSAHMENE